MAWLMVPATIGPILGPPLGGFIVTYLSWRWIFYINVPIGLLGIVLATLFIDETARAGRRAASTCVGLVLSRRRAGRPDVRAGDRGRGAGRHGRSGLVVAGVLAGALYWRARAAAIRSPCSTSG